MKRPFGWQMLAAISVYAFALSILWNSFGPLVMPYLVAKMEPELKNTYLGLVTTAGLIVALVVQPLAGGLSDRSRSRWGRRRPFILVGTLFDLVFLLMVGLAGSFWPLFVAYCLLQTSSNVAHGPYQGFIPDLVPNDKKGIASGVKNLVELIGLVLCSLVVGGLLGQDNVEASLAIIAIVLAVSMIITLLTVHEEAAETEAREAAVQQMSLSGMVEGMKRHRAFVWYVVSRFLILSGLAAVRTFAQTFLQDVLHAARPAELAGQLMTVLGICVLIVVLPAGYLADRVGRKRLNVIAALIGAMGTLLMVSVSSYEQIVMYGAVVGMAVGVFLSANWALAMDLIPPAEAALFLGLTNLATAGSGAATGLLGPMIDGINAVAPATGYGYRALFIVAAACWGVGAWLLAGLKVPEKRAAAA